MKHSLLIGVFTLPLILTAAEARKQLLMWPDAAAVAEAEVLRDKVSISEELVHVIAISDSQLIRVRFSISTKGNGTVTLPGLTVGVYDNHNDGIVFRDNLLQCAWIENSDSPYLNFLVTGIAMRYDEKGKTKIAEVPVRAEFRYSAIDGRYFPISCSAEIEFWSSELN